MDQNNVQFEINPALDRAALQKRFIQDHRLQIRDVLEPASAEGLREIFASQINWGLAWRAAPSDPKNYRFEDLSSMQPSELQSLSEQAHAAIGSGEYGFLYRQYPMLEAYLNKWDPGHPLDKMLEHLNSPPFLDLIRDVTGIDTIIRASAQATSYEPGNFLSEHDDSHSMEPRRVAYVLHLTIPDWKSEWGGFLNFFDEEGNVSLGLKPVFNSLNLFRVPQRHSVSLVAPSAPVGRFSITGWAMDP
ncbi:Proline 4-hydroxylase (includes Rps23 Pro-64 3,4-dihydroxylase Tpa1), contains SM-20 domain [Parasphingorhabdus marina DSM 22363]|uniref:Proline 4-hydroxylase (Includes Rps23 Pro-64 3,4-dihydroxylase Tpa1), contains SM-20 domain n=1 Tax=Parasphingorhabdus marina DSM 22363 TaxID=1123272 RepID=A0A1N6H5W0_9SPHN|nr:2OG-Fe(II) oxygenase family protein [Parasphingorhabdus marina]SIO15164.1 Proline 4-hydroxylase (includes Rps23 Pro-64 3,4-dihydroxylase Tpa1), contains SM-20 domain [Parasphingorhabdus marina DSM 22363]